MKTFEFEILYFFFKIKELKSKLKKPRKCGHSYLIPIYFFFFNSSGGKIGGIRPTDGSGCPRCGFVVYEAEKMISKKSSWHKRCFNCADCHKSLDSTNLCDGPNGEIYCRG